MVTGKGREGEGVREKGQRHTLRSGNRCLAQNIAIQTDRIDDADSPRGEERDPWHFSVCYALQRHDDSRINEITILYSFAQFFKMKNRLFSDSSF